MYYLYYNTNTRGEWLLHMSTHIVWQCHIQMGWRCGILKSTALYVDTKVRRSDVTNLHNISPHQ